MPEFLDRIDSLGELYGTGPREAVYTDYTMPNHERSLSMRNTKSRRRGFTLVEIMIVVLIIGVLLAIAVPNFISARQSSRAQAIVTNLRQVDAAKENCAMEDRLKEGDLCVDYTPFIKRYPPVFPVPGPLVEGAVGTYSTFKAKTADEWTTDKTGL